MIALIVVVAILGWCIFFLIIWFLVKLCFDCIIRRQSRREQAIRQLEEEERQLQEDIEMVIQALTARRLSSAESNSLQVQFPDENEDDTQKDEPKNSDIVPDILSAPSAPSATQAENCVICFEPRNGIFAFDCGHAVTCIGCATKLVKDAKASHRDLPKCPVCRKQVSKMIKVFT